MEHAARHTREEESLKLWPRGKKGQATLGDFYSQKNVWQPHKAFDLDGWTAVSGNSMYYPMYDPRDNTELCVTQLILPCIMPFTMLLTAIAHRWKRNSQPSGTRSALLRQQWHQQAMLLPRYMIAVFGNAIHPSQAGVSASGASSCGVGCTMEMQALPRWVGSISVRLLRVSRWIIPVWSMCVENRSV